ncbi:MAG: alpha/beta fold hydrolase [Spirochaetales bacterium]|nr:alpha/beta fold hydrolase [Spirochaetales bacterium]
MTGRPDEGLPATGEATLPIFKRYPGVNEAILLIHGYTGYPGELSYVADALFRSGHTVHAPRLPGHGTNRADFMATGARDWLCRVRDAYIELHAEYGRVGIVGHSMGGALTLILAAEFAPPRIALLAPAVELSDRRIPLTPLLGAFIPVLKAGAPPPASDTEGERLRLHREYREDNLVRQAAKLWSVVRRARSVLPRVQSRILVISGEKDASVPPSAAGFVSSRATAAPEVRTLTLADAGHVFPMEPESREECSDAVSEWFAE